MGKEYKSIKVYNFTHHRLAEFRLKDESLGQAIDRLLDFYYNIHAVRTETPLPKHPLATGGAK